MEAAGPIITSVVAPAGGNAQGPVGGSADVLINGEGFGTSPSVNASEITVSIISSKDTQIHARFTIPTNQPGGGTAVTVTSGGQTSAPNNSFFVQIPTTLVRTTYPSQANGGPPNAPGVPNGYGPLMTPDGTAANGQVVNAFGVVISTSPNQCGVYRNLSYSIVDQQTPAQVIQGLKGVSVTETFSGFSGAGTVPDPLTEAFDLANCPGGTQGCFADVVDNIYMGHSGTCLGTNENQSFTQAFSVKIGQNNFPLTIQNSVARGNFQGTLKADVIIAKN